MVLKLWVLLLRDLGRCLWWFCQSISLMLMSWQATPSSMHRRGVRTHIGVFGNYTYISSFQWEYWIRASASFSSSPKFGFITCTISLSLFSICIFWVHWLNWPWVNCTLFNCLVFLTAPVWGMKLWEPSFFKRNNQMLS